MPSFMEMKAVSHTLRSQKLAGDGRENTADLPERYGRNLNCECDFIWKEGFPKCD